MLGIEPRPAAEGIRYSAEVLSAAADIEHLTAPVLRALPEKDTLFEPAFFLASLSEGWSPRAVAVRDGEDLTGVLYAKERTVAGVTPGSRLRRRELRRRTDRRSCSATVRVPDCS